MGDREAFIRWNLIYPKAFPESISPVIVHIKPLTHNRKSQQLEKEHVCVRTKKTPHAHQSNWKRKEGIE